LGAVWTGIGIDEIKNSLLFPVILSPSEATTSGRPFLGQGCFDSEKDRCAISIDARFDIISHQALFP